MPGGEAEDQAPADPLLGRHVGGKFLLEKLLGAGAMGAVYRARQTALEKVVAIKVMHAELARDAMFAARFHREAKAASRLDHPNSIRILDYGQDPDGLLYIAMEFLDGRDLAHLLVQDWPLPDARIVDLVSQALGAIAVAHDLGITHRDLKPENIMVLRRRTDDGVDIDVVKVCDFGIAKLVEASDEPDPARPVGPGRGKLTTAGLVIGTPAYMSPEQGRGEAIDGRSDLYSMGVILYQMLTGQLPFDAPTALGLVVKHQTEVPAPPSSLRAGVDPRLEAVCLRAMAKSPADRYQTARELRAAIRLPADAVSAPLPLEIAPTMQFVAPVASEPEVATARTELQLAPAPTGSPAVFPSQGVTAVGVPGSGPARRWPLVGAGLAIAGVAFAFAWGRGTRQAVGAPPAALAGGQAELAPAVVDPPAPRSAPREVVTPDPQPAPPAPSSRPGDREPPRRPSSAPGTTGPGRATAAVAQADPSRPRGDSPATGAEPPRADPPGTPDPAPQAVASAPVVAPPAVAPAPPESRPAAAFDRATATVDLGTPTNVQGTTGTSVINALAHARGAVTECYRRALPGLTAPLEGGGKLHIETDDSSRITRASVDGPGGASVASCIAAAVNGSRVGNADTGGASADIPLTFRAR